MTDALPSPEQETTALRRFFAGAGFPACLIAGTVVYEAFLMAVIFMPAGSGIWGQFSEDFKRWCFSYDPRTGGMSWGAVWVMLAEPVFLTGITTCLWRKSLRPLFTWRGLGAQWKAMAGGGLTALLAAGTLFAYGSRSNDVANELLPFPGERIRTQIEPPAFVLTDHRGAPVSLEALKGRVVLITGVYTTCSTACPEILREVKNLTDSLPPDLRGNFSAIALSLNPEYDSSQLMNAVASAYGFAWPAFRYVNGDPAIMHELLTRLQFSPVKNGQTGAIDHANLFILLDARGTIAYRFNLTGRHLPWLHQATRDLLKEAVAHAPAEVPGT